MPHELLEVSVTRWLVALLGTSLPAITYAEPAALDTLVAEALRANPTVTALQQRELALRAHARAAGAWPDPMVSVEVSNAPVTSWRLSDHPMSGVQLRVEQQLRPPGWSRASRALETLRADGRAHEVAEARLELAMVLRKTWWALARSRMLRDLTETHRQRTEELQAAIQSRYETGSVGQHAVLRLLVLRDRLQDDLGDFDQQATALEASLAEAVAGDVDRAFPTPASVEPRSVPVAADWGAIAAAHRPLLAKLRSDAHAADQSATLARLDAMPDPTVWTGYRIRTVRTDTDQGTDFVSVGVGIPVPLGSARRANAQRIASLREADAVRSSYDATLNEVSATATIIVSRWQRARAKTEVYDETLIPAARSALRTAQADFRVGRADVSSLYDAEVDLIDLERARVVAAIDTHLQHAEAIAVLGAGPAEDAP